MAGVGGGQNRVAVIARVLGWIGGVGAGVGWGGGAGCNLCIRIKELAGAWRCVWLVRACWIRSYEPALRSTNATAQLLFRICRRGGRSQGACRQANRVERWRHGGRFRRVVSAGGGDRAFAGVGRVNAVERGSVQCIPCTDLSALRG